MTRRSALPWIVFSLVAAAAHADGGEVGALRARVERLETEVVALKDQVQFLEQRIATGSADAVTPASAWRDPLRWNDLRRGMNRFRVMQTLGEPGKVTIYDGFERWEYPDLFGGRANFDARGALVSWRPPRGDRR